MTYLILCIPAAVLYQLSNINEHQGLYYVVFYALYTFAVLSLRNFLNLNPKNLFVSFFLSSLVLLGTNPILENDQYRYFWEGKIVSQGFNPYKLAPSDKELNSIDYPERNLIAYNNVKSIYPPLAQTLFFLASPFSYKMALFLFQLFNLFTATYLLILCFKIPNSLKYLPVLFPLLQKEFVQSVHLDLIAAVFLTLAMLRSSLSCFWASFFLKIKSIVLIPLFIGKSFKNMAYHLFLGVVPLLFWIVLMDFKDPWLGLNAFSSSWRFNSLSYLVCQILGFNHQKSQLILTSLFLIFCYNFWKRFKNDPYQFASLTLSSLFFFSPVYNPWYGIWLVYPALRTKNLFFLLYAIMPMTSYLYYESRSYEFMCALLTHCWYFIALYFFKVRPHFWDRSQ
ncbi:MAG: hypothetical protein H6620_06120 [Halobacteriovoraceae bacterium]|nr:hypothetical protein [Halobacteriovoraceae bacterium]